MLGMWLVSAAPAVADDVRLDWPLRPPPAVARGFDAPSPDWNPGHRGVDLPGTPGQPVYAAGPATVVFAGLLAGRPVVSLAHPGGLRTSYEPVRAAVRVGQRVTAGTVIGELVAGHAGCPVRGVLALGSDVGSGIGRPLRRSAGPAEVHADPPQATEPLGPGVGLVVHRPQPGHRDMGVELGGRQTGMPEQLLDHPQVGSAFEQVRGRAVA